MRLILAACFALALLALGDAAHLRHHLMDPGCDSGLSPESHPCVTCSGLHGGALAAATPAVAPCAIVWSPAAPGVKRTPSARAPLSCAAPRAPPLA